MPHNRLYINAPLHVGDTVTIEDEQYHYIKKVLRAHSGDTVELINGKGVLASALLEKLGKDHCGAVITSSTQDATPTVQLTLALALTKQSHLEYALEKATEVGAGRFLLFPATRSEKEHISETQLKRLNSIIIAATKQCGRLFLPDLVIKSSLKDSVKSSNTLLFGDFGPHTQPLSALTLHSPVTFFVGPEGGFTEKEREFLITAGATGVSLHHNTLRAETAAVVATLLIHTQLTREYPT